MRLLLVGLLALLLTACGRQAPVGQEAYVFGTRVEVIVWGAPETAAHAALGEVLREFDRLHRAYHAWQPSELTALNDAIAAGRPHEVSAELAGLIRTAQQLAAQGERLFDPGIGRLVALWGFHADEFRAALPDPAAHEKLVAAHPSIADLKLEDDVVTSRNPAVALDFGGYLKGVALDRAAAILKRHGLDNALINIGGNVMALGKKGDQPWRIGIQHPRMPAPLATLPLYDGEAVGTSGDYQRYFELEGERYAHLLDPRTGQPARGTQSLTILITPREGAGPGAGTLSDAPSKPAYLVGEHWREHTRRFGIEHVLRVAADGRVEVTRALRARLQFPAPLEVTVVD